MINQRKDRCFQEAWLEESEFKDWLRKDKTDKIYMCYLQ